MSKLSFSKQVYYVKANLHKLSCIHYFTTNIDAHAHAVEIRHTSHLQG